MALPTYSKLTDRQKQAIFTLLNHGWKVRDIAVKFGNTENQLDGIIYKMRQEGIYNGKVRRSLVDDLQGLGPTEPEAQTWPHEFDLSKVKEAIERCELVTNPAVLETGKYSIHVRRQGADIGLKWTVTVTDKRKVTGKE